MRDLCLDMDLIPIPVYMDQTDDCERLIRNDDMEEGDLYVVFSDRWKGQVGTFVFGVIVMHNQCFLDEYGFYLFIYLFIHLF